MARIFEWPREHRGLLTGRFRLRTGNISSTALFSGEVSPYGPVEQRWTCDLQLPMKRGTEWRFLSAMVTRMRGMGGFIRIPDYFRLRSGYDEAVKATVQNWSDTRFWDDGTGWASGYLPPFVVADAAAVKGDVSLVLRGLPVSTAQVLRMGDLFEHRPNGIPATGGRLYEVIDDCRTDANGKTRVYFEPGLRVPVSAGDMIVLREPSSVFRLIKDDEGIITRSAPGNIGQVGMSFLEFLGA